MFRPNPRGGHTAFHLEGSARNKTYLEFEGKRQELLKSWVA